MAVVSAVFLWNRLEYEITRVFKSVSTVSVVSLKADSRSRRAQGQEILVVTAVEDRFCFLAATEDSCCSLLLPDVCSHKRKRK